MTAFELIESYLSSANYCYEICNEKITMPACAIFELEYSYDDQKVTYRKCQDIFLKYLIDKGLIEMEPCNKCQACDYGLIKEV